MGHSGNASLQHSCPRLNKLSSKAVETFQVIYDNLTEATGTAERLLEGHAAPPAEACR
jgi:hypothetical protein